MSGEFKDWIPDLVWLVMPTRRNKDAYVQSIVDDRFLHTFRTVALE
jgi:hypothetical protein